MMSMLLQPYSFACTDAEQHVHKVASLGDLPRRGEFGKVVVDSYLQVRVVFSKSP